MTQKKKKELVGEHGRGELVGVVSMRLLVSGGYLEGIPVMSVFVFLLSRWKF